MARLIVKGGACIDTATDFIHIVPATPTLQILPAKSFLL